MAAKILHPGDGPAASAWVDQALTALCNWSGTALARWLTPRRTGTRKKKRPSLDKLIRYVSLGAPLMNYPHDRERGWQIGTGMMEPTCKQLVGVCLKGPGMHWSEAGALAVTALRAQSLNKHWHPFWNTLVMNA